MLWAEVDGKLLGFTAQEFALCGFNPIVSLFILEADFLGVFLLVN
jgi:hypothetical protein